jgi:hypothetical protein
MSWKLLSLNLRLWHLGLKLLPLGLKLLNIIVIGVLIPRVWHHLVCANIRN